jgi:hypothetical protein
VFGNVLIVEMEKKSLLVEKVVMYSASAKDMIRWNMLQIGKLIGMVTFKELNKTEIKFYPLKNLKRVANISCVYSGSIDLCAN